MSQKEREIIFLLSLLGFCLIFQPVYPFQTSENDIGNYEISNLEDKVGPPVSNGYWNLTSEQIYIDDLNPSFNWSESADAYDWITGQGSKNNPYHIENVTINGQDNICIDIQNSKSYFIINNVTLFNSSSRGINLVNVTNANITHCKIFNCSIGMWLYDNSSYNSISNNDIFNCSRGIQVDESIQNDIHNNTVNLIDGDGIWLKNCNFTHIYYNDISHTRLRGIYLSSFSSNNSIYNNSLSQGDSTAISVTDDSDLNLISNNTISHISQGILILYSNNNTVLNNQISDSYIGLYDWFSFNSTYHKNSMQDGGFFFYGTLQYRLSTIISKDNTINNKTLYHYKNRNSFSTADFLDAGQIILTNCSNAVIKNHNLSACTIGVDIFHCRNITVKDNRLNQNLEGIKAWYCNKSLFDSNKILTSQGLPYDAGIELYTCFNSTTKSNVISNFTWGITLAISSNHTISENIIKNCSKYGLRIDDYSGWNNIYKNNFYNNDVHAIDNGTNNQWDNEGAGNYWDDYSGVDSNNDGIGETPYVIEGEAGNVDNFPLMSPYSPDEGDQGTNNGEEEDSDDDEGDEIEDLSIPGTPILFLISIIFAAIAFHMRHLKYRI